MIKNTYDSLGRITGINHSSHNDKTLADYHYKWDAANRITEINDDKYGYDKTNQLLSAVYVKKPKEQYAYDLNGNRLTALLQGQEKKYETGKFHRLLSENGEKLEYDAEGNRISKGNTKYFWDHRNRLVKVISPSETIEYTYDYQNRLVSRKTEKGKEYFVHDGWQIVLILNGNGSVKERLLWGTKQDELICDNDNWTLGDHLNTIREVVDVNGKVMSHYDYNAFGKCLSPLKDLSFAYTGKLTDSATGLQWNINRWYDSSVGRWISEDPIGFEAGDGNLYRYVGNFSSYLIDVYGTVSKVPAHSCNVDCDDRCKHLPNTVTYIIYTTIYNPRQDCIDRCKNFKNNFNRWYTRNRDITWTESLPICPCKISKNSSEKWCINSKEWNSPTSWFHGYHKGATVCMRSRTVNGHANQCCYNAEGDLITSGSGQGSSDIGEAGIWGGTFGTHKYEDMVPADWATFLDNGWGCYSDAYLNVRPQVKSPNCVGVPTPQQ